ncbi:MAG: hypothetical protein JO287_13920 [Pseudonocardiales bacterium]|nr:hypothetical protein [Pseudonocardiales bacterium]
MAPTPSLFIAPAQPKRLRGQSNHLRIEVQRHHLVTFQPGLEPDMITRGGRPPPTRETALTSIGRKRSHRRHTLKPGTPAHQQRHPALGAPRAHTLDEHQIKPRRAADSARLDHRRCQPTSTHAPPH